MTANDLPPGEADNADQGGSNSAGSENSSPKSSGSESDRDKASLVVLANRLPFDLEQQPDGSTKARQAPGGLVTALQPILSRRHGAWVGWPGTADTTLEPTTTGGLTLEPIALSTDEVNDYYEGFSNATLWPLYHDAVAASEFHRPWWDSYHAVNARFAERAAEVAAPNATVWIHDYQLQLVPEMLRQLRPDVRIGFFLHIPFPPAELFNRLPWRRQILTGLLGADLIGFQLPGGTRNFVRLARSLLDVPTNGGLLSYDGRTIRVAAFPISIDSAAQSALAATPEVREAAKKLRVDLGSPSKIILGVDRLDYTKGIDVRLTAFRELLAEKDPSVEDAVMVQIATPSRERLQSYIKMREGIERQVGSLNGDFGKIGRPAVHYLHQSFPREELATFYVAADVMTVTPLRDGMNLVAKEYVACRVDGGGTLLLSEFTGAARELRAALQVNPYDTDGVKDGLRAALTMSTVAARRQMRSLRRQVLTHDVDRWAAAFLSALEGTRDRVADARKRLPSEVLEALDEVSTTERLLIATDFDGTLAPIVDDPGTARALPGSVEALRSLASISDTVVAVVSGRSLADLRMFLGENENLQLVGSHGAEVASPTADGSQYPEHTGHSELAETAAARLAELRLALAELTDRYGRVNLEPKPTGIAVHLRGANEDEARAVTTVIEKDLATLPGVQLLRGKMVLELTVVATDKGQAVQQIARDNRCTAIVFIGDDVTDEDAFQSLGSHDVGVKVGDGPTAATVRIVDPAMVRDLLQTLDSARRRSRGRDAAAQSAR